MLQVLWERVWIDTSKLNDYTIICIKDKKDKVIQDTYLLHLMKQCGYLSEEDTELHYIGNKLGATVDRTPKCHP